MKHTSKDLVCGAIFASGGLFVVLYAWSALPIGSTLQMGPGYFPLLLGLVLVGLGIAIAAQAWRQLAVTRNPVSWRGAILVVGAVIVFAAFARPLGFGPTLAVTAFMAAMASREATVVSALLSSAVLTAFCIGVFVVALRLPYPVFGPWLGG